MTTINGTNGNDILTGTSSNDVINAGNGNDTVTAGNGNDTIYGDESSFTYSLVVTDAPFVFLNIYYQINVTFGSDTLLSGGNGNDFIVGDIGTFSIEGSTANGRIGDYNGLIWSPLASSFTFGNDALDGGNGNDILIGDTDNFSMGSTGGNSGDGVNAGSVFMFGFAVTFGEDTLNGGEGNDLLIGDVNSLSLQMTGGDMNINGWLAGIGEIGGDQFLFGTDTLNGGNGNDILIGDVNSLEVIMKGGENQAQVFSGSAVGGAAYSVITQSYGNDILNGGEGNDSLYGDVKTYLISMTGGSNTPGFGNFQEAFAQIRDSSFTFGNDNLIGANGNDMLYGEGDSFALQMTSTLMQGDPAADFGPYVRIYNTPFTFGDDNLDGGNGNDTLVGDWDTFTITLQDRADVGDPSSAGYISLERTTVFNFGDDRLDGGAGDDVLVGDARMIQITSQTISTDFTSPHPGNETIRLGNDTLIGGSGNDLLYGDIQNTAGLDTSTTKFSNLLVGGNMNYEVYDIDLNLLTSLHFITPTTTDAALTLVGSGTTTDFASSARFAGNFADTHDLQFFAERLTGAMNVTTAGDYTFFVTSDDGGQLFIDLNNDGDYTDTGELVVSNDGLHTAGTQTATVYLTTGNHNIAVTYYQFNGDQLLDFGLYHPVVWGNDTLQGGTGNDYLNGGGGTDTAVYSDATSGVTVNLNLTGPQSVGGGLGNDTLVGIENLIGSTYNDTLIGDGNANVLRGGTGNDVLNGGGGNDTADYSDGTSNGLSVDLTAGTSSGSGLGSDTLTSIENLIGSAYNDTLKGTTGDNIFTGGMGNDTLDGRGGMDTAIFSGTGHDQYVFSYVGGNIVVEDLVSGRDGTDTLTSIENLQFADGIYAQVFGTGGNDTFIPVAGTHEIFFGLGGDDTVSYATSAVSGAYYEVYSHGGLSTLPDFSTLTLLNSGIASNGFDINVRPSGVDDNFAFKFTSTLAITNEGDYTFTLHSDDGGAVYVDGVSVAEFDAPRGPGDTTGDPIHLIAGNHGIQVVYYEDGGGQELGVSYNGLDTGNVQVEIPASFLTTGGSGAEDAFSSIENFVGSAYNDILIGAGGNQNNTLTGGAGADTFVFSLATNFGHDTIIDLTSVDFLRFTAVTDVNSDLAINLADVLAQSHVVNNAGHAQAVFNNGATIDFTNVTYTAQTSLTDILPAAHISML